MRHHLAREIEHDERHDGGVKVDPDRICPVRVQLQHGARLTRTLALFATFDDEVLIEKPPADVRDRLRRESGGGCQLDPTQPGCCATDGVEDHRLVEVTHGQQVGSSTG